jgi:glutamine synthetase
MLRPSLFKNFDELINAIATENIEFIDFRFTDIFGNWKHVTYKAAAFDSSDAFQYITFDGSSVAGCSTVENSDALLCPHLETAFLDPFTSHKTLVIICDIEVLEKSPTPTSKCYAEDPRAILNRAIGYLQESGVADTAYFGPELEFFLFDAVESKVTQYCSSFNITSSSQNAGHSIKGEYMNATPRDGYHDLRSEILMALTEIGVTPIYHHHEVANMQSEIVVKHCDAQTMADNVQKIKYTARQVAKSYGKHLTFLPKPVFGQNGSGMHIHQSLWKDGKPIFHDPEVGLSKIALYYIGGILKHARALNALTNPTINSYKRLVPNFEAPVELFYARHNRTAAIRVPFSPSPKATRIEVRFSDPMSNPYLAFAALIMAGLDGIANKIIPMEAADKEKAAPPKISASLGEALNALDTNREFLKAGGVFTDRFCDVYISLKRKEIQDYNMRPTPMDFHLYDE